jgi:hypothetical protein
MVLLYADENFDFPAVRELRLIGYDVLTAQEAGQAHQRIPDEAVLAFATSQCRAVLTFNRRHFIRLHSRTPAHGGIIFCSRDDDSIALANRIHQAICQHQPLQNKLLRVNLPAVRP